MAPGRSDSNLDPSVFSPIGDVRISSFGGYAGTVAALENAHPRLPELALSAPIMRIPCQTSIRDFVLLESSSLAFRMASAIIGCFDVFRNDDVGAAHEIRPVVGHSMPPAQPRLNQITQGSRPAVKSPVVR